MTIDEKVSDGEEIQDAHDSIESSFLKRSYHTLKDILDEELKDKVEEKEAMHSFLDALYRVGAPDAFTYGHGPLFYNEWPLAAEFVRAEHYEAIVLVVEAARLFLGSKDYRVYREAWFRKRHGEKGDSEEEFDSFQSSHYISRIVNGKDYDELVKSLLDEGKLCSIWVPLNEESKIWLYNEPFYHVMNEKYIPPYRELFGTAEDGSLADV